jgi:ribosomal protein S18 acetylase RimI-like enzyme
MTHVTREARPDDVSAIASLHRLAFPDYFLTHLGARFLQLFYREFVNGQDSFCVVAVQGERLIGVTAATLNSAALYRRFYRNRFPQLAAIVLTQWLRNGYVRREIGKRALHVGLAFRALIPKHAAKRDLANRDSGVSCRLLSIAVHPDSRGQGVASRLTFHLFGLLRARDVNRVGLSVFPENTVAMRFYRKNGWLVERVTPTSVYLYHDL